MADELKRKVDKELKRVRKEIEKERKEHPKRIVAPPVFPPPKNKPNDKE